MLTLRSSICVSFVAVAVLACKPPGKDEDKPASPIAADDAPAVLAEQMCAQLFACGCPATGGYADEAECIDFVKVEIQNAIDLVVDDGGSWNAECAGELAKAMSEWECLGPTMASRESSFNVRSCPILKGTLGLGNECWQESLGDNCQEGLACIDNICVEALTLPVPEGGICEYEWETLPCASGTWCTWDQVGQQRTCQPLPQAGDPCPDGGYTCGPAANDLVCEASVCTAAPGEGESCEAYLLCSAGLYCDGGKDFTCQPRQELGDGCGGDPVCPVDASCINNLCEADPAAVCSVLNLF
jgi:hypothetical protein